MQHRVAEQQRTIQQLQAQLQAYRHLEQRLYTSELKYSLFFEQSRDGLSLINAKGIVVGWNQALEEITGVSKEEAIGQPVWDVQFRYTPREQQTAAVYEQSRDLTLHMLRTGLVRAANRWMTRTIQRPDGTYRHILFLVFPIETEDDFFLGGITSDITEKTQTEELYRTLVENSLQGMLIFQEKQVVFANPMASNITGYQHEELLAMTVDDVLAMVHPEDYLETRQRLQKYLNGASMKPYNEFRIICKNGEIRCLETSTVCTELNGKVSYQTAFLDSTEHRKAEQTLLENERFVASGKLAASVAHEINTPLQSLEIFLELVRVSDDVKRDTFLDYIRDEIQRIGSIVHQLLDLYQPRGADYGPVEINSLIDRLLLLFGKQFRDQKVSVERNLSENLPPIWGQSNELTQVLLNLIVNALDAMPDGGRLLFMTHVVEPGETASAITGESSASGVPSSFLEQTIEITIQDTGSGINPDLQAYIFEPFMTSKKTGTGLGLAISHQIVQQHHGYIAVQSQPGIGSTFTIVLPVRPHSSK